MKRPTQTCPIGEGLDYSEGGLGESEFLSFNPSYHLGVEPRNYSINQYRLWDDRLDKLKLVDFINTGDMSSLGPDLVPVVDETDFISGSVTRNIRFFDKDRRSLIVINGIGYSEVINNDGERALIIHPPNPDMPYDEYVRVNYGDTELGTTLFDKSGRVVSDRASGPLGAYSKEGVDLKVQQMLHAQEKLFPRHFPDIAIPKILGGFKYGRLNAYGIIYETPPVENLYSIKVRGGEEEVLKFVRAEFRFISGLFAAGYVHNQLHVGNKGLTSDGRLYIGDMESLAQQVTPKNLSIERFQALRVAIRNDLTALLGIRREEFISLDILNNPLFSDFLDASCESLLPVGIGLTNYPPGVCIQRIRDGLAGLAGVSRNRDPEDVEDWIVAKIAAEMTVCQNPRDLGNFQKSIDKATG